MIADIQRDAIRGDMLHVDFMRVDPDKDVQRKIPVRYHGRAAGVMVGGKLKTMRRVVKISAKPAETRMGKGKGDVDYWAASVKPGTVLYELGGVTEQQAKVCFARLAHKMPIRVRFVRRRIA